MIDFVDYKPPTGAKWAEVQKEAGFSNQVAANNLDVSLSTIKRIRNNDKEAPKALFFLLCIYANVGVVLYDEPEQPQ
jgi:hypothetical protein